MLKIPFLRNILLVSVLFAVIFPLFELTYTIPSYRRLLIQQTEFEASRFVRFLVSSNYLDQFELAEDKIPASLIHDLSHLNEDGNMVKLRIFAPSGKIVFSSEKPEIGQINKKKYFRDHVAKGQLYSKMVKKETATAEGVRSDHDLIETYVPIMVEGHFHGAMEVYSDVTESQQKLTDLAHRSFISLVLVASGLLVMTLLLLFRAKENIRQREQAEKALQQANDELEERVELRTAELSSANQLLAAEVAERKKAQLAQKEAFVAISEARDRINAIISSVGDALLVTDHLDAVVLCNPAAEALFGVSSDQVRGQRLPDVIGYDSLLLEIAKARKLLKAAESVEFDFELEVSGFRKIFQCRASRLKDAGVSSRGLILLIHDVTRVRQIDRMKSEFVSMAAHELQTPLTMVLGYSELLLDPEKSFDLPEVKEFLRIINDKSIELSGLIDDILDLSRIEDGRGIQLSFSQVDFSALCRNLLTELEGSSRKHRFVLEEPNGTLAAKVDEARMLQVMENLLGNAVKYSPEGGLIRVRLEREENWLKVSVIDQGIGMSEEQVDNAFERFYRGDASNTAVRGTGLGLSIARYIVDAHGGTIDISSQKGKGTCLLVRLPLGSD